MTDTQAQKHVKELEDIYAEAMRELDAVAQEQKQLVKKYMDALKEKNITKLKKELQG
jgi:hypothetical protein